MLVSRMEAILGTSMEASRILSSVNKQDMGGNGKHSVADRKLIVSGVTGNKVLEGRKETFDNLGGTKNTKAHLT